MRSTISPSFSLFFIMKFHYAHGVRIFQFIQIILNVLDSLLPTHRTLRKCTGSRGKFRLCWTSQQREREKPEERVCVDERDLAHRTHSPSLHTQSSSASLSTSMFKCLHPILRLDLVSHSITKSMLNKWKCDKQPKQSSVTHSER